jgi:hypothetical protein
MKLSQFNHYLDTVAQLHFVQPQGTRVPDHFHITEAGLTTKHFVDCGGTLRTEKTISFQLWTANDVEHRLEPQKLKKIIALAEPLFGNEDLDIEIEYQTETISRYGLDFDGSNFILSTKQTNCLAPDRCGIPAEKPRVRLSELTATKTSCCTPNSGCC